MAHSLSAKKRIRQSEKRRGRNRWRKDRVKEAIRQFEETLSAGNKEQAAQQLRNVSRLLDKVSAKGTIHKNTASRKKARLARQLNKAAKA